MYSFYIISYDLRNHGRDYTSLYDAIKSCGDWIHPLESTWIVYTNYDASEISNILRDKGQMEERDLLFVCKLQIEDRQGWLNKSVWRWIKDKL